MKALFSLLIFILSIAFPSIIALAYTFGTTGNNGGDVGIFVFFVE